MKGFLCQKPGKIKDTGLIGFLVYNRGRAVFQLVFASRYREVSVCDVETVFLSNCGALCI